MKKSVCSPYRSVSDMSLRCTAVMCSLILAGCGSLGLDHAPKTAHEPWRDDQSLVVSSPDSAQRSSAAQIVTDASQTGAAQGFTVPIVPELAQWNVSDVQVPSHPLSLPELIDLAQRQNPQTRQAWNNARQAALAIGVVEATFLPMLSANVIAGHQRTRQPLPLQIGDYGTLETDLSGVVPALALGWLLFDFGQREALLEGATQLSRAANVLFNATHQKVIRDVTDQFYQYNTARTRVQLAREALQNQQAIERAVTERVKAGVATTVEQALIRQAVAQARLYRVQSEGVERTTYLALLGALGIEPTADLQVAPLEIRQLPPTLTALTMDRIRMALTQRPDLVASYAAMKAAQAGERAAEAEFLPKVFLGAVAANSRISFDVRGLPGLNQTTSSTGVLVGVTLPLYDGGLRRARLRDAQIRTEQARHSLETRQKDAVREIIAAETLLQTALESAQAADQLVSTATTANDAAFEAYKNGVGTVTVAIEAANSVLKARQASLDAYSASMIAAANLAFVMGDMTVPKSSWMARSP